MDRVVKAFLFLRIPLALAIVGVTFVSAGIYFIILKSDKKDIIVTQESAAFGSSASAQIIVHIAGAVVKPGIYTLDSQARLYELVDKAGGLADNADREYVDKNLNFAQLLKDSQKIYVPEVGEANVPAVAGQSTDSVSVNINSASKGELESLVDIGPARADKIIESRPYIRIEELVEKKIIPESVFNKIRNQLTVSI